ncbi:MAG: RES family NAD+ phosphorylase, partial [Coriobacteriia bacterium]|nr:RES family NAD+ phosphorylase [Coriobacteriia bacterium]
MSAGGSVRAGDSWEGQRRRPPAHGVVGPPAVETLLSGSRLWRIHRSDTLGADYTNVAAGERSGGRFDVPEEAVGHLYAGDGLEAAVAETLLRRTPLADQGPRIVPFARVAGRTLSVLEVRRDLRLIALHGPAAAAIGQGLWLTKCDAADYPLT